MFRCKSRNPLKCKFLSRCADRISDRKNARIKYSDNISCICLIYHMTGFCHHLLWLKKTHLLIPLHMINFLGSIKFAGTDSHKCDTVTVCFIHICLNLKYKCREIIRHRINLAFIGYSRKWRCCHLEEMFQKCFHTKVCQRRTKKDRCHISFAYLFLIKIHTRSIQKFDFFHQLFSLIRIHNIIQSCIINVNFFDHTLLGSFLCIRESQDFVCVSVINSAEFLTGTDRPVDRTCRNSEFFFYFIKKVERVICITVHFIDKCKNRNVAHNADFE